MSQNQTVTQTPSPTTTTWTTDPSHSQADFVVRHLMISNVRGSIPVKSATIVRDERDITKSTIEAVLDVAGITSGSSDRDKHLRSADFFDIEVHPTMTFVSTRVETVEDGLRVHGDLTIRAVSQPVVLDVELLGEAKDPWGGIRAGLIATTQFDRRDFGLTWNLAVEAGGIGVVPQNDAEKPRPTGRGGILVGDKVKVHLDLQAVKQP